MITIAGGTGRVGTALTKSLVGGGNRVRVLTRDQAKATALFAGLTLEIAEIDFGSPRSLRRGFAGADRAFISTGTSGRQVEDEVALISAAIATAVPYVVNLSVGGAGAPTVNPVLEWHTEIDAFLRAQDIASAQLKPTIYTHTAVGLGARFIPSGAWGGNCGQGRTAFIDARDVADVAARVLLDGPDQHAGNSYALSGPEALSMHEIAALISSTSGISAAYHDRTVVEQRAVLESTGLPPLTVDVLLGLDDLTRSNLLSVPTRTVQDLTGHAPRSVLSWIQENLAMFTPVAVR